MLRDARLAVRSLTSAPGYVLTLVATLAVGIGATTALFSVVYGVLMRPLPYPEPGRLVVIEASKEFASAIVPGNFSAAELEDWTTHTRAFSSIAMHGAEGLTLATADGLQRVTARTVSPEFFRTLGLPMLLGRPLAHDRDPVMVVSHAFWVRELGADPDIVGQSVAFHDRVLTVVGVAPPALQFPSANIDVFTPMAYTATLSPERFANRNRGGFQVFGRLKAGVSLPQAAEDVAHVHALLEPHYVEFRRGRRTRVAPMTTFVTGVSDIFGHRTSVRPVLLVLFAAVCLAMLVACANAANLMLARQTTRTRELAVRTALGASRGRLLGQCLTESAIVAIAGGVAGIAIAVATVRTLQYLEPAQLPRLSDVAIDVPVLLFACLLVSATVLLAGALPAYRAARIDVHDALRASSRTHSDDARARRLRSALVIAEVAAGVVLLVGASLLGRSLWRLLDADLGVRPDHVITAFVDLNLAAMPQPRQREVAEAIVARVAALPGVSAAGIGVGLPPNSLFMRRNFRHRNPTDGRVEEHVVNIVPATPGYFDALAIRLRQGRTFTDADAEGAQEVTVITADAARRYFGDGDPVGRALPVGADDQPVTILGVVDDVRYTGIEAPPEPVLYVPYAQLPFGLFHVAARTASDPLALAGDLRALIRSVDPHIAIVNVATLDQVISDATMEQRVRTMLFGAIAMLAVLLAAVGLYGVVAYGVSQRTAEIGVRMALGARPEDVLSLVLRSGLRMGLTGAAIGVVVAYSMSKSVQSLLYDVAPSDSVSYGAAAGALILIALAGSYLPARRAMRVDPIAALRTE